MFTKKSFKPILLSGLISSLLSANVFAAVVPEGTVLADKQEVRLQTTSEYSSLDPQKSEDSGSTLVIGQMFEGLVDTDDEGKLVPAVAESWEASPDFKVWTYHLRKDAKWSNGDPVTAHDFVYAWQRLVDPKTASHYANYLEFMKVENVSDIITGKKPTSELGVKALDDHTFQVTLSESVPYAVDLTTKPTLHPVHRATVEKYGDKWLSPENFVSNGAYVLSERVLNEKVVLTRNPNYWNNKAIVIDKATYFIVETRAGFNRFRAGELDISYIPEEVFRDPNFRKLHKDNIINAPTLGTFTYQFNTQKAPFDDVRLRKALSLALDRSIITDKILGFGQKPAFTYTPPYIEGGQKIQLPEYAKWTQAQRNEEAKKLLAEAGYSKANPLKMEVLYNTSEGIKQITVALASILKKNTDGALDITLRNQEWKTFLETKHQGHFQLAFFGWNADYNEATTFLTCYLSNNEQNFSGFKNEKFDELVQKAYRANSNEERQAIYAEAEAELDSHHPFIPVYHYAKLSIKNPKLKGYTGANPLGGYDIKDFYLEK